MVSNKDLRNFLKDFKITMHIIPSSNRIPTVLTNVQQISGPTIETYLVGWT